MIDPDLFVEFDVVYRAYVVGFGIVERPWRERLYIKYLSRVFDITLRVERAYLRRLFSLIVPVLRVVIVLDFLIFIDKPRADILKREVWDVGDSRSVDTPIHLESKPALNLKIKTSLPEFVVEIPLVKSKPSV